MRLSVDKSRIDKIDSQSRAGVHVSVRKNMRDYVRIWGPVLLLWLILIAGIVYIAHVLDYENYGWSVYDVYHKGAQAVIAGDSLYSGLQGWVYLYPPLLAQSITPIALATDTVTGQFVFFALNLAVMIGSAILLQPFVPVELRRRLWIGMILFVPMIQALYIGQITILMFGLLVWVWVAVQKGQHRLAGSLLALAAWIKVYPAVLVIYFLWKRDWCVIQGVAAAGVILGLVQIAISGPQEVLAFFETLFDLTANGQPFATYENMSVFAFASRLFEENELVQPLLVHETLFRVVRWLLTGGIFGLTALAIIRANASTRTDALDWRFDLEYALVALTTLMLGSTLWISGLPPLLLVYVLILRNRDAYRHPDGVKWVSIISYGLVAVYLMLVIIGSRVTFPALLLSVGFFGLLLVWGVLIWLLLFESRIHGVKSSLENAR